MKNSPTILKNTVEKRSDMDECIFQVRLLWYHYIDEDIYNKKDIYGLIRINKIMQAPSIGIMK